MMVIGLGAVDQNGQPVKYMINGKPESILYALDYLQEAIDGQMIPGINKIQEGTGQNRQRRWGSQRKIQGWFTDL